MWTVRALIDGDWVPVEHVEVADQLPSSRAVRDAARERLPLGHKELLRYLDQEVDITTDTSPAGGRDAIQLWGKQAESEARQLEEAETPGIRFVEFEGAQAIASFAGSEDAAAQTNPFTLAWHDRTSIIIPLQGSEQRVEIAYMPDEADSKTVQMLHGRFATPEHRLETILDWRGYFGRGSAIVDGWSTMRRRGKGFLASLRGTFGFVVGGALRRVTRPQPTLERDPLAKHRLRRMCQKHPAIAQACRDLAAVSPISGDDTVVFVHGTASCGIQGLKDLYAEERHPSPAQCAFRYEHDTFRPLFENGSELAGLIAGRIQTKRLLLAGHSRGGLVARWALELLRRKAYPADMYVFTFGTPHAGTPLAAMGGKALNLLFSLGGEIAGAIPVLSPLVKAYSYLTDSPSLPPGIEIMREGSDALAILSGLGDSDRVSCWGSAFDIDKKGDSGFGVDAEGALLGALRGKPNDLVVPTESATAFGAAQPVLDCSHVQYFLQPQVRAAIRQFLVSAPSVTPSVVTTRPLREIIKDSKTITFRVPRHDPGGKSD